MSNEQLPDNRLFDLYRSYIGEPDARIDVYLGFGLFFGGIVLGAIALALFLWSGTFGARSDLFFVWREPAFALGMLSLPTAMLGIVVLLPVQRRALAAASVGTFVTAVAVGAFVYAYPEDWNGFGADHTAEVVAVYAAGLAVVTASTGAALIAQQLDRMRPTEVTVAEDEGGEGEHYTDEEIQSDIDAAMEDVELSWGGVAKTEHRKLQFKDTEFDVADVDVQAKQTRSTGVDAQVAGLKGLKGGEKKTATSSSTVDDQTAKLNELREQRRAEELAIGERGGRLDELRYRLESVGSSLRPSSTWIASLRERVRRN